MGNMAALGTSVPGSAFLDYASRRLQHHELSYDGTSPAGASLPSTSTPGAMWRWWKLKIAGRSNILPDLPESVPFSFLRFFF